MLLETYLDKYGRGGHIGEEVVDVSIAPILGVDRNALANAPPGKLSIALSVDIANDAKTVAWRVLKRRLIR